MANVKNSHTTPITLIKKKEWSAWLKKQSAELQQWLTASGFTPEVGNSFLVPANNKVARVIAVVADTPHIWSVAALPERLPAGKYHLDTHVDAKTADNLLLGWLLGSYRFTQYKKQGPALATLAPPANANSALMQQMADSINLARDLINTPANDLGPAELAAACKKVAQKFKAHYSEIVGEELLTKNYPAIYEVGKASTRAPRLIDIRWGNPKHPKITLVGKGVCFDSGGLDIKTSGGMKLMKKDMGGAACLLALAQMIMSQALPVRLRLLIPAVENSIAGNAYRPSDVIKTRKGISVEVGNTDAEGRLILCDALHEADQEKPDLLIDCATLTGAARTALGPQIPGLFTPDDQLANNLLKHSAKELDPLWRLPLWADYRSMLGSEIADINSAPDGPYAGAITAALYLHTFVEHTSAWAHIDMMAWNLAKRPGRPVGGEAMMVRALFAYIQDKFGLQKTRSK